jgi:hypothetical protein
VIAWEVLRERAARAPARERANSTYVVGDLVVRLDVVPPLDRITLYLGQDDDFRLTWNQQRKFKNKRNDNSPSVYECSLASQLIGRYQWSDQDIVDVLIYWRRMIAKAEPHDDPADYYRRTLEKAHTKGQYEERTSQEQGDLVQAVLQDPANPCWRGHPGVLDQLSTWMHCEVTRVQLETHDAEHVLYLIGPDPDCIGCIGSDLHSRRRVDKAVQRISQMRGRIDTAMEKPSEWQKVRTLIAAVAEVKDLPGATVEEETREWVETYLASRSIRDYERGESHTREELGRAGQLPFRKEGARYFWHPQFKRWLRDQLGEHIPNGELCSRLEHIGVVEESLRLIPSDGDATTVRVRRAPTEEG